MSTRTLLIAALLLAVLGAIVYVAAPRPSSQPVACTMEAKICPDGSAVGRTGPNCEFAACPDTASGDGSGILPYHSGIRGTILAGPTCPVEHMPPDPQCADK